MCSMAKQTAESQEKRFTAKDFWRLLLIIIGVIAVVQELRKPQSERTWHGAVGGFVPYDFRKPTVDRFRDTYWNPEGPIVGGKAWGVGWAPNFGAMKKLIER